MQTTRQPQRPSPYIATSSATSSSAGNADYATLVRMVESLQQEMTEMREKIVELGNTSQALQTESELWYEVQREMYGATGSPRQHSYAAQQNTS